MNRENWPRRLAAVGRQLPAGVELLTFPDVFPDPARYEAEWPETAKQLDGLVLFGSTKEPRARLHRLGPGGRMELISLVKLGKPVLLAASGRGLVPVIDCDARRAGTAERPRTLLTVPPAWDSGDPEPTLTAALEALRPVLPSDSPESPCDT